MGGEEFPLDNDSKIFELTPPQNNVGGPYVVYKDLVERWP